MSTDTLILENILAEEIKTAQLDTTQTIELRNDTYILHNVYEEHTMDNANKINTANVDIMIHDATDINIASEFVAPQPDDYILCKNEFSKCNALQRIVHLLKIHKTMNELNIYDYISTLKNYDVSILMEDWYQCKNNHFQSLKLIEWFMDNEEVNCNATNRQQCNYIQRHQRERGNEMYQNLKEIDHQNAILVDLLDSVHAFIFHSESRRFYKQYEIQDNYSPFNDEDMKYDLSEEESEEYIWSNYPESISECTLKQIIYILTNENIFDKLNRLSEVKNEILSYFKENKFDGKKLSEINRKTFMTEIANHMNNNKLKGQLGTLYSKIMKYELPKVAVIQNGIGDPEELKQQESFVVNQTVDSKRSSNKFVTSVVLPSDEKSKIAYYAFGLQPKYTPNLLEHPLYVAPIYDSIKQELCQYYTRINEKTDLRILRGMQLEIINTMEKEVQLPLADIINENVMINHVQDLWYEELKTDAHNLIRVFQLQSANWKRLNVIIETIFKYVPNQFNSIVREFEYFVNYIFVGLLDANFGQQHNVDNIEQYLNKINDEDLNQIVRKLNIVYHSVNLIKECKRELNEAHQLEHGYESRLRYAKGELMHMNTDAAEKKFKAIVKNMKKKIKNIKNKKSALTKKLTEMEKLNHNQINDFQQIFNIVFEPLLVKFVNHEFVKELEEWMSRKLLSDEYYISKLMMNHINNFDVEEKEEKYSILSATAIFSEIIYQYKKWKHFLVVKSKCDQYPSLQMTAEIWSRRNQNIKLLKTHFWQETKTNNIDDKLKTFQDVIMQVFEINKSELTTQTEKYEHQTKNQFTRFAKQILQEINTDNRNKFVKLQNNQRSKYYIKKAIHKLEMQSVKEMKAIWYQSLNQHHQIAIDDGLTLNHIIALVVYTDDTNICTAFRETYRYKDASESLQQLQKRHSNFAIMGRLMYEAFIFYASKDSKVQVLYHGMSIALLFPTLHCSFDCPTSTTTEPAVAVSFGQGNGIILKFESCDSSRYIRTLDMGLFSCFDEEYEHLIFETRVHMKDIAIPSEKGWIGYKWMKVILLYDLLVQGRIIHNSQLLKKGNQNRLCKMLQLIMDDNLSYKSQYFTTLVLSVTQHQQKIWLNTQQIQELNTNLKKMFVEENNQFGEFIVYLKNQFNLVICPIFITKWKMSEYTFDLISRVTEKYDNIGNIQGHIIRCNLPNNKQVVFRPQLIKTHKLFNVRMELIDVSDNRSITVHFEIECRELNTYYTSSHPKLMDTKHYNEYVITLPTITQDVESISLGISIMIHNFEDFNVDYKNFNKFSKLTVMTENMIRKSRSYKMVDSLSIFYG
eukprot:151610_1